MTALNLNGAEMLLHKFCIPQMMSAQSALVSSNSAAKHLVHSLLFCITLRSHDSLQPRNSHVASARNRLPVMFAVLSTGPSLLRKSLSLCCPLSGRQREGARPASRRDTRAPSEAPQFAAQGHHGRAEERLRWDQGIKENRFEAEAKELSFAGPTTMCRAIIKSSQAISKTISKSFAPMP